MEKTYHYSLTEKQMRDCTKRVNAKKHNIALIIGLVVFVVSIPLFIWMVSDRQLWDIATLPAMLFLLSIIELLIVAVNKNLNKKRDGAYFVANHVEGKLVLEVKLGEKGFKVSLPLVDKDFNYSYDYVSKIKEFDSYAIVMVIDKRWSYMPIVLTEDTKPLVETLKVRVAETWRS